MMGTKMKSKKTLLYAAGVFFSLALISLLAFGLAGRVQAKSAASTSSTAQSAASAQVENNICIGCHTFKPGATMDLPSGEKLPIYINPDHYKNSVHASKDITCTGCHSNITGYPHPKLEAQNLREVAINMSATCEKCHSDNYKLSTDSVHHKALIGGNENAAVCSDCHAPHEQPQIINADTKEILPEIRTQIPQTCSKCHSAIYNEYKDSVHGAALTGEGNPDVPTCTDCHGVHNIGDPTTPNFRLQSPQMCANCHTDEKKMAKYGLSTQVLSTYVADFHGTTVTLFQKQEPGQQTNKPVCFDCHGVHNIAKVDDPQKGLSIKENVLVSCQKCHPDANTNFPDSWLSHYIPSPTKSPIVYYVSTFYKFFVPTVLGGMALFVVSDGTRRIIDRRKGAKRK